MWGDEYHSDVVTVYLYFLGWEYFDFKYPHWLMEEVNPLGRFVIGDSIGAFDSPLGIVRLDEPWRTEFLVWARLADFTIALLDANVAQR